jgi:hypothetical protein
MRIKPITYFRLALLLPYLVAAILIPIAGSGFSALEFGPSGDASNIENMLTGFSQIASFISGIYLVGAIFWLIPYTILALILLVWISHKSSEQIIERIRTTPIHLSVLIPIYSFALAYFLKSGDSLVPLPLPMGSNLFVSILALNVCAIPLALIVGNVFVSVSTWLYDIFRSWGIIVEDDINIPSAVQENNAP